MTRWAMAAACAIPFFAWAEPRDVDGVAVELQYSDDKGPIRIEALGPMRVIAESGETQLPPGVYEVSASEVRPARRRYHVFPKTFQPDETAEQAAFIADWRARGHAPEVEIFGPKLRTRSGRHIDNRIHWISLARFDTLAGAEALRDRLAEEPLWAWIRAETVAPGEAAFTVRDASGAPRARIAAPMTVKSGAPLRLLDVNHGFWQDARRHFEVPGPLHFGIGPESEITVRGAQDLETYLKGVLPAEMPAAWPAAALQAQAVVARSETLAHLAGKHRLEGFDFCVRECCRAYRGRAGHDPRSDAAVDATAGEALVHGGKIVLAVFSASCGGHTENNENVWAGPPNAALRGVSDFREGQGPGGAARTGAWVNASGGAWCADDERFRWTRRFSAAELSDLVNQRHRVGRIQRIELGDRGVSGRLRRVRVIGSEGTATLERELAIRQAFGGLPSAMFIMSAEGGSPPARYVFRGGGRGHGVGMCQHGARGMAQRGRDHGAIVRHYFAGSDIERLE